MSVNIRWAPSTGPGYPRTYLEASVWCDGCGALHLVPAEHPAAARADVGATGWRMALGGAVTFDLCSRCAPILAQSIAEWPESKARAGGGR